MDDFQENTKVEQEEVLEATEKEGVKKEVHEEASFKDVKCEQCAKVEVKEDKSLSVFVLGLLAILMSALEYSFLPLLGFIFGLIAVVRGNKPRKLEEKPGFVTAGWIMGIVGMIACGIIFIFNIVEFVTFVAPVHHFYTRYFYF